ncbi:MAG: InlB B-repeat-containing protein [Treponema sp.]|nr:InlB B-repeat-containing protein [Treponema sp.]
MKDILGIREVFFNTNGGNPVPSKQNVWRDEKVKIPSSPVKAEYDFAGWYSDNETFLLPWDFNEQPYDGMTLHAYWVPQAVNAQMPNITVQPLSRTENSLVVIPELIVTSNVSDGGTLTYQWYRNTVNSTTEGTIISGANSVNYQPPRDRVGTVFYYVVITNTIPNNGDGGIKIRQRFSNVAGITILGNFFVTNITQWNEALTMIQNSGNNQNYIINTGNYDIDGITPLTGALTNTTGFGTGTNLTITLTGSGTLNTANINGNMIRVGGEQEFIIDGGITLNGRRNGQYGHTGNNTAPVIAVQPSGILRLKNGTITGNRTESLNLAGGIHISDGGTSFIMEGGKISGNETAGIGGGVAVNSGSTFTMSGGEISGNTAETNGGGVNVSGMFNMTGGEISGNIATSSGGVSVIGTFNMTGGIITSNIARQRGGGITVNSDATFTKTGNSIITGFVSDSANGNVVRTGAVGTEISNMGHAVFRVSGSRREKTVEANENLSFIGGVETGNWIDPP